MGIRKQNIGSGLTEREAYIIEGDLTTAEKVQLDELDAMHTVDGRLAFIERACLEYLNGLGLPTVPCSHPGGFSNEPAYALRATGYPADGREVATAEMLALVRDVRRLRDAGELDRAMMYMYYLGAKCASSGIKDRHGAKSGRKPSTIERDKELARKFLELRPKSRLSDSALKEKVGREFNVEITKRLDEMDGKVGGSNYRPPSPLRRARAIQAIDEGLKILSG